MKSGAHRPLTEVMWRLESSLSIFRFWLNQDMLESRRQVRWGQCLRQR